MIGKAKSNKSLGATLGYNLKEKAVLVFANRLAGETLPEYRMQMEDLQKCYAGYARQLTIHAILSPSIEDGKKLTPAQWRDIAGRYMEKMGLASQQAMGFLHADKEHRHLHLVINKVKEDDFKLVHDSFIGKKSQQAADAIATEMGLVRAMEIRQQRQGSADAAGILPAGAKQAFKALLLQVLQKDHHSVQEYFAALEAAGFMVHAYKNKETGTLRGYGLEMDGTKMDASAIGRQFTLQALGFDTGTGQRTVSVPEPVIAAEQPVAETGVAKNTGIALLYELGRALGESPENTVEPRRRKKRGR